MFAHDFCLFATDFVARCRSLVAEAVTNLNLELERASESQFTACQRWNLVQLIDTATLYEWVSCSSLVGRGATYHRDISSILTHQGNKLKGSGTITS